MRSSLPLHDDIPDSGTRPPLALLAKGFRPFFLFAAALACSMVPLWLFVFFGAVRVGAYFDPVTWHAHEMVFGFAVAVLAGFLLTAVGNWTHRETLVGAPLAALSALWIAGRVAVTFASAFPRVVPAVLDLAFLPALVFALARPLVRAKNRRNFVMLAVLVALFVSNVAIHLEALGVRPGVGRAARIAAIDIVVLVMLIMAGRVFPMFTRNATQVANIRSSPVLDASTIAAMALLTAFDVASPDNRVAAVLSCVVAVLALLRARTWGARHSLREPMLFILHAGYLWIPFGLILRGAALLDPRALPSLATHALTAGAMGSLTLGMMVRVALGHTGRLLRAPKSIVVAFALVTLGAIARVVVPLVHVEWYRAALIVGGTLWSAAFAIYLFAFAPILATPRIDGKRG